MRTENIAALAFVAIFVLMSSSCVSDATKEETPSAPASPALSPPAQAVPLAPSAPPLLAVTFPHGQELRFRRIVTSSAHNASLPKGRPDGVDLRVEAEYVVRARDGAASEPATVDVRLGDFAAEASGLRGDVSFDTRKPETLEPLEHARQGQAFLQALKKAQSESEVHVLSPAGNSEGGKDADGRRVVPPGLRIGWFPGMLPFGDLTGSATTGASWRFDGVLRAFDAGLHYDDPLIVHGTWRVASWDPRTNLARLELEGGTEFDDRRLRTTRVDSCDLHGEAIWDAQRQVVMRSSVTSHVVLRVIEVPKAHIDWKMTFEESLVP